MSARYIVVVGCGRLGSTLASALSQQGDSVVVIDVNEAAFDQLSAEFSGFRIPGDASELAVLREAKVEQTDVVCAVTDKDNLNLFVAQAARELFGVEQVVARLFDPSREPIFEELGVLTISPTMLAAEAPIGALAEPLG
jgi:trk system potassium uptake protein TrkA